MQFFPRVSPRLVEHESNIGNNYSPTGSHMFSFNEWFPNHVFSIVTSNFTFMTALKGLTFCKCLANSWWIALFELATRVCITTSHGRRVKGHKSKNILFAIFRLFVCALQSLCLNMQTSWIFHTLLNEPRDCSHFCSAELGKEKWCFQS